MKVASLSILAVLVAVNADVNADVHKNITVTSQEIDSLMSDFIDYFFKYIKANGPMYKGDLPPHDIISKDVEVKLKLTNNAMYLGEVVSKSVSSNLSDSEYSGQIKVASKGFKFEGTVIAEGTVKGKAYNEVGGYGIVWSTMGYEASMKASYDDHSVTVVNYDVDFHFPPPQIFLKGLSVDEATLNEITSLYGQEFDEDVKLLQENAREHWKSSVGPLNALIDGNNIQELYDEIRKELPPE